MMPEKKTPKTETEYAGTVPLPNTVQPLGQSTVQDYEENERQLEPHEQLRLGRLTGQTEDTEAPRKPGFMYGVDPDFPDHEDLDLR
jgi:hypothetical protein